MNKAKVITFLLPLCFAMGQVPVSFAAVPVTVIENQLSTCIGVQVTDDSWVELRRGKNVLYADLVRPGKNKCLQIGAPIEARVGVPDKTKIVVDGVVLDLGAGPFGRAQVSRIQDCECQTRPLISHEDRRQPESPKELIPVSSGSGFFVSSEGHLVTNNHVVEHCRRVDIRKDGRLYQATAIATDKVNDLALLSSDITNTDYLHIGDEKPQLLEEVFSLDFRLGIP